MYHSHHPPPQPSSSSLTHPIPSQLSRSFNFFASSNPSSHHLIRSSLSLHPHSPLPLPLPLQLTLLDSDQAFDSVLPTPFRSLYIVSFNLFTWASILLILHLRQSNSISLLLSSSSSASLSNRSIYHASYYASLSLLILASLSLLIHRSLTYHLHLIPPSSPLLILPPLIPSILLLLPSRLTPFSTQFRLPQRRFLRTLHRIFFPPSLLPHSPTPFHHILLADLLTSLSRPLGDLASFLVSILFLPPSLQASLSIAFSCLPYLLRFKQCLNDLLLGPRRLKSSMNAIKYSTAIPMIFLNSRLMRSRTEEERRNYLITWILACSINSIYSSWWDIVNDWGISRREIIRWYRLSHPDHRKRVDETSSGLPLTTSSNSPPTGHHHHPISLPGHRILFDQQTWWGYLILIAINLTLRMTWTIGIFVRPPKMMGIRLSFLIELIEIIRRSIWCLVRLEWEEINRKRSNDYYLELTDDDDQLLGSAEESDDDDEEDEEEQYDDHQDTRIDRDPIIVNHPHPRLDPTKKTLEDEPCSNHPHPDSTRDLKIQSLTPTLTPTSPAPATATTTTTTTTSSHHHPFLLHPSPPKIDHHHHHPLLKIKKNHT